MAKAKTVHILGSASYGKCDLGLAGICWFLQAGHIQAYAVVEDGTQVRACPRCGGSVIRSGEWTIVEPTYGQEKPL